MRLPTDAGYRLFALVLTVSLAGCGVLRGADHVSALLPATSPSQTVGTGPAADYPIVLGDPFTVDGELFTPTDALNYDAVGYVAIDEGAGVTAAHRTLPLPSYAEVTSLENGKTVLVRVERRGPMVGKSLLALSPAAGVQLGISDGNAVRVRRVNPPEVERAELRAGRSAPERIETPQALVQVLRRKLPAAGAANLHAGPQGHIGPSADAPANTRSTSSQAGSAKYPLPRVASTQHSPKPVAVPATLTVPSTEAQSQRLSAGAAGHSFLVQAGSFANRANADRAAKALGGFVTPAGKIFRVRTGPFATRAQADAALAKVRAAGYSDARVTTQN